MSRQERKTIRELKESAKWSRDPQEMKNAVTELAKYGDEALPALEEILTVTAYEDIRAACIDAIKGIKEKKESTLEKREERAVSEGEDMIKKTTTKSREGHQQQQGREEGKVNGSAAETVATAAS